MNRSSQLSVDFDKFLNELGQSNAGNTEWWEYQPDSGRQVDDASKETERALRAPVDFPSLDLTVVDGDKVALAVDPNLPQLIDVIVGVVNLLAMTDASQIAVVLGDEASDETIASLRQALTECGAKANQPDEYISVARHDSADRESLRYLGADADALPWYINRQLVDADVVIPIVTQRPTQPDQPFDITGIYPTFTDSATRNRFRVASGQKEVPPHESPEVQVPWLIGVQLMVFVAANHAGNIRQVIAGMPQSLTSRLSPVDQDADGFPPPAKLVIASTDGDAQQQSWANAARAALAASRFVQPGGTIVVWTDIDIEPGDSIRRILEANDESEWWENAGEPENDPSDVLPTWDPSVGIGMALARVATENRVVIRSRLARERIEPLGLGSLESLDELKRFMESFESCGVLRGAQFLADAVSATHRLRSQSS